MGVEEFVVKRNVAQFRHEMESSADAARRVVLLMRLVEEQSKLRSTTEQVGEIERQIAAIKDIVAKQLETVAVLRAEGRPFDRAERALSNLLDLLAPHEAVQAKIEAALPGG